MNTVVILDNNHKEIEGYQRMLMSFQKQIDCKMFEDPEEAIEYVKKNTVAVIVCELKIPIMSGREVLEMVEMISPSTIRLAMTQVKDVTETLELFNRCRIFKLILKPFFLVEDLEEPIQEALKEYEIWKEKETQKKKMENELEQLVLNIQQLSIQLEKKKKAYNKIYQVANGFMKGNLNSEMIELNSQESNVISSVCEELLKEFMRYYMFEVHNYKFHLKRLQELFHHPEKGCLFQVQYKTKDEASIELLQKIAYGIFLGGYLCQQLLVYYRAMMMIEKENSVYVLRMFCQYSKGENMYKIKEKKVREFIKDIIAEIANTLSVQFVKGVREQEFAVKMYFKEEGE